MLSVIIGAILAYLLALYLTAPLSNILVGIRRVATGDFEHRVVPPQAPELRAIGESFNDMSLAIRRRIRNLELLNQMASEVSMARRLRHIANTVEAGCEALLDVDARMWVLDQFGEKLQSVPTKGIGTRGIAHPDCPVTKAARESKVMVVGEGNADLPPGSQVSQDVPAVDAAVIVPMRTWEGAVGSIVAVPKPGVRAMTQEQVSLAVAVANIAAPAVAALVRNESQARSARMLQRILVPQPPFAIPGIEVASRYEPADEAGRLGGDFFDFTHLSDGSWCFVIGDVSGKGLPAAQYAAMAKYVIRSYALEYKSPLQAVTLANFALSAQMGAEAFITIFCGILDIPTGRIRYARAGHPPPLIYRKEAGDVISLRAQGPPAGAFEDAVFAESEETIAPGDVLVMFTDGLIEARRHHEMFGEEELAVTLRRYGHLSPKRIADSIVGDVRSYAGGKLEDDMAIVVVKIG
jgi:serine phosphatase RsbU (regulator of sigma subunit)/HAMP domain-containing protein